MPFALAIIGLLLVVSGFQNTHKQLGTQVVSDLSGKNSFLIWIAALGVVGALGYVKELEPFSRAFLVLIIIGIFLSNKGVFTQFNSALTQSSGTSAQPVVS